MNYKQFLKPDWRKIVLFFIIAFLGSIVILSLGFGTEILPIRFMPEALFWIFLFIFDLTFIAFYELTSIFIWSGETLFSIFSILTLFYWYILSCSIVLVYDRYFKKLKKKYLYWIVGVVVLAFIAATVYNIINNPCLLTPSGCGIIPLIEKIKNDGCRAYLNQNPACSDATAFNVTYQGSSISFYDFIHDANTYNCADETCIRQMCACPAY
jgi:hypothetical protein